VCLGEALYKLKPVLEITAHEVKTLINVIHSNLTLLAPVYGSNDWDTVNIPKRLKEEATEEKTLHRDDEYAGRVGPGESVGDSIFGDTDGQILATVIAGPEGCTTASISLHHWRVAHSQEPVAFLRKFPMFESLRNAEIEVLACAMKRKTLSFRETLVKAGSNAEHLFMVKEGSLAIQQVCDEEGNAVAFGAITLDVNGSKLKTKHAKMRRKSICYIGQGDVYDETVGDQTTKKDVYAHDLVCTSSTVEVYLLAKKLVMHQLNSTKIHTKAVLRDRKVQREEAAFNLTVAEHTVAAALAELPPEQPPASESLRWPGSYRVPRKYDWSNKPMPSAARASISKPMATAPSISTPTRPSSPPASPPPDPAGGSGTPPRAETPLRGEGLAGLEPAPPPRVLAPNRFVAPDNRGRMSPAGPKPGPKPSPATEALAGPLEDMAKRRATPLDPAKMSAPWGADHGLPVNHSRSPMQPDKRDSAAKGKDKRLWKQQTRPHSEQGFRYDGPVVGPGGSNSSGGGEGSAGGSGSPFDWRIPGMRRIKRRPQTSHGEQPPPPIEDAPPPPGGSSEMPFPSRVAMGCGNPNPTAPERTVHNAPPLPGRYNGWGFKAPTFYEHRGPASYAALDTVRAALRSGVGGGRSPSPWRPRVLIITIYGHISLDSTP